MNHYSARSLRCLRPLFCYLSLFYLLSLSAAHAAALTGNVSNVATRNLLEGARVEIPALGLTTLTDNTGRYLLAALPAGTHEVVVTYVGLDSVRTTVIVAHRPAMLKRASRVYVLERGRLVQQGGHAELLGVPGYYQTSARMQGLDTPEDVLP